MEKDKIFFGENGLTSTSANYICNLAKESYMALEKELEGVNFVTTTVQLIGSNQAHIVTEGVRNVDSIRQNLLDIAQLKSLIAWLREAIKAKDRLINEAKNLSLQNLEEAEVPSMPEMPKYITEDDVVGSWNIKQRNRYYYLETLCAELGKYIHPEGRLSVAREDMMQIVTSPHAVVGNGRDALFYSYMVSLDKETVEDLYMKLQNEYRGYQAELNSMKHEIQTAVEKDKNEKDLAFKQVFDEYSNEMGKLNNQLRVFKNGEVKKTQNLKIIIPDSLKPIYTKVSELGK